MTIRTVYARPAPQPPQPVDGESALMGGLVVMPLRCSACRRVDWQPVGDVAIVARSLSWKVKHDDEGHVLTCPWCTETLQRPAIRGARGARLDVPEDGPGR